VSTVKFGETQAQQDTHIGELIDSTPLPTPTMNQTETNVPLSELAHRIGELPVVGPLNEPNVTAEIHTAFGTATVNMNYGDQKDRQNRGTY